MNISVVISTYNRAHLLSETLDAFRKQRVSPSLQWEIIVVDNNSSDFTQSVVEACKEKSPVSLRYVFESRQGLSQARNTGIRVARGEAIAFTDDDIIPDIDWVDSVNRKMNKCNADGIGGRILPQWLVTPPDWLLSDPRLLKDLAIQTYEHECVMNLTQWKGEEGLPIWGGNMAFRRSLFAEIGGFDTNLGRTGQKLYMGEEPNLIARAIRAGKKIVYDPEIVVWHRIRPEQMSHSYLRRRAFGRGEGEGIRAIEALERHVLGIPLYFFRYLLQHAWRCLRAKCVAGSASFREELVLIEDLGFMLGRTKSAVRANKYLSLSKWVKA